MLTRFGILLSAAALWAPAVEAQVEDVEVILELMNAPVLEESTLNILVRQSLEARSLDRREEEQLLARTLSLLDDDNRDTRLVAMHLAFLYGERRQRATRRILDVIELSQHPATVIAFISGSHHFTNDGLIVAFLSRVAERDEEGGAPERAVHKLFERGAVGRARLNVLHGQAAIKNPRARRVIDALKREGKIGGK